MVDKVIAGKIERLHQLLMNQRSLLVAFSGGVDSSVLAKVAVDVIGNRTAAATIDSPTFPRRELAIARHMAAEIGIRHIVIAAADLDPELVRNSCDRCYFCKQGDLALLRNAATAGGYEAIAYGVTTSDYGEHRPGLRALAEAHSFLPLVEAGIKKSEVEPIALALGSSNHDLPSTTCLSSRIPYGEPIHREKLVRIEAAEDFLFSLGFRQVRVRHHGDTARIEVLPAEIAKLLTLRGTVLEKLKALGFAYVTVDWQGYRSGSMDEVLKEKNA